MIASSKSFNLQFNLDALRHKHMRYPWRRPLTVSLIMTKNNGSYSFCWQRDVEHTLTTVFIKLTVFAAIVLIKKCDEFLDHKFQNKSEIWNKRTFVSASHFAEKQFMLYIHRDKPTPVLTVEPLCATTSCKRPSPTCDDLSKTLRFFPTKLYNSNLS